MKVPVLVSMVNPLWVGGRRDPLVPGKAVYP
jgi:hypothetical protein